MTRPRSCTHVILWYSYRASERTARGLYGWKKLFEKTCSEEESPDDRRNVVWETKRGVKHMDGKGIYLRSKQLHVCGCKYIRETACEGARRCSAE